MKKVLISLLCWSVFTHNSFASEVQEKMYLTLVINQLNAMQPLIMAAKKAQPENTRLQFHYTQYRDSKGHWHHGLLEDVQTIKAGIQQKLNTSSIEPRAFAPIKDDYLNK